MKMAPFISQPLLLSFLCFEPSEASESFSVAEELKVPGMLDCEGDGWPEDWRNFRLAARQAVEHDFFKDPSLEATAAKIEEQWRPWVCPVAKENPGSSCTTSSELGFEYVRELHRECRDSNNFERYLVRHYFTNTKVPWEPLEAPSGFCLYGYITALMVLAWHALPEKVGKALANVYTAQHMLGHYHSFDFLESSSWPIHSFLVLINFHAGQQWVPLTEPPEYAHPGQFHRHFYYERLSWNSTVEASKPNPGAAPFFWLPFAQGPPRHWRGRGSGPSRPHIVVWQFCIHTSTAGEAVTMITRFLKEDYDVEFRGNSLARQICKNYYPSMCAEGRHREFLEWLSGRFEYSDTPYEELSTRFQSEMLPELSQADVWMCSIPAVWCRLLADAGFAENAPTPRRPVFAYLGLPILQYVKRDERQDFLQAFVRLARDERNIVAANNAYLAEEVAWQTGIRVPTLRIHGLHTNSTYLPLRLNEVIVSRPGTSGGWQECVLNRFVDANPGYPLRFVQFTNLLNPNTTKEVYNFSLSYNSLSQFRAAVSFPYDTSLMFFWEFYSMNMPLFIPFQLWRWGIFGQHTRPDLDDRIEGEMGEELLQGDHIPPFSPFFDGFSPLDVERSIYWSKFTDWAMFPHLQYFESIGDLMAQLVRLDLQAVSAEMKRFNEECLVKSVAAWRYVVERWFDLETLTE
eukprot:TRINITY_DN27235_c0_g1_i1.p1 TRINITY_DN27235_c0_g1~~TRINITY_DN27235_c0_g1_i1.p1  ORF type:complete len:687 (+),score=79.33 TRINITY_DN27235_c0_g1_i1:83-2143(+)